jgi:ATP synthase protein I
MNDQTPEKPSLQSLNKQLDDLKKTQVSEEENLAPSSDAARAAIDFTSACAVGVLLGYGVDHYAETSPWGILIGLGVGVVTGVYLMFKAEAIRAMAEKKKETK